MTEKLVSIIIPNFNSIKFIEETIYSVLNQSYKSTEIIVVDDGSSDGSFEYIEKLNVPNLILVKNPNKGACAARNHGLRLAKGDYIQFLDADDVLDPTKIEAQVALLDISVDKIAVCSTKHFYESKDQGLITDRPFLFSTNNPIEFLLNLYGGDGANHNMVAQHAWLTPKTIIDKAGFWNEDLIKDQDGEFFCRVVMASKGISFSENVYCYYRKHRQVGSISSGKSESHLLSQLESLNSKAEQLKAAAHTSAFKKAMALQYKIIAIDAIPEYKSIYNRAIHKMNYYGGSSYVPVLGGKIVEGIKTIFGWKIAKTFSHHIHRIRIINSY